MLYIYKANRDTTSVYTVGLLLMKRDFVSRMVRTQTGPNSCLDICINKGTSSIKVITGVVPATTPLMPKSEQESVL